MRILITGASGFLGSNLMKTLNRNNETYGTCFTNNEKGLTAIDFTDSEASYDYLEKVRPEVILHTIALTNVDECQTDINKAYRVNVLTTKNIVNWALNSNNKTRLLYISSDHIYNGNYSSSEDEVTPLNNYALTKLFAEEIALKLPDSIVLRVNFFGISNKKTTYFDWLNDNFKNKQKFNAFNDVFFSPLYMKYLCELIAKCVQRGIKGIYNLGSSDSVSKAEFAFKTADIFSYDKNIITPISINDSNLSADRPNNMAMDSSKFEKETGISLPNVGDSIQMLFKDLR